MLEWVGGFDWRLLLIPLISGVIGYVTNWVSIRMIFFPVRFVGVRVPGLAALGRLLPRKLQQVPGVLIGKVGWQGVVPARAAKMGSIAVDKGIAKLGSPGEFYEQLQPDLIAQHILTASAGEVRRLVEQILEREHPRLWRDTPPQVRDRVHARVQAQLPDIVRDVTSQIGQHIDDLLDIKLMVIRHIEERPQLANRIFLEVGRDELKFVINAGLWFGILLGIPTLVAHLFLDSWWVLPIAGVVVGYLTNVIAIWMIFEPVTPRRLGPLRLQGLFIKRQAEVSEVYAEVIAEDVITVANIGRELSDSARADRTRHMIRRALRPAVDRALGPAHGAVRIAVGTSEYDAIGDALADEAVAFTMVPLTDETFNRQQAASIRALITERMLELPPEDFAEMLRSAIEEDEWMLMLIGGALGFVAGCLQAVLTL